jgi:hypothetical protein
LLVGSPAEFLNRLAASLPGFVIAYQVTPAPMVLHLPRHREHGRGDRHPIGTSANSFHRQDAQAANRAYQPRPL